MHENFFQIGHRFISFLIPQKLESNWSLIAYIFPQNQIKTPERRKSVTTSYRGSQNCIFTDDIIAWVNQLLNLVLRERNWNLFTQPPIKTHSNMFHQCDSHNYFMRHLALASDRYCDYLKTLSQMHRLCVVETFADFNCELNIWQGRFQVFSRNSIPRKRLGEPEEKPFYWESNSRQILRL
jgi:hypothetical protein